MPTGSLVLVPIDYEVDNGPTVSISRHILRYRVVGLPDPQNAEIVKEGERWRIIAFRDGQQMKPKNLYQTAEEALAALQSL